MGESIVVICPTGQAKYFSREGWTGIREPCPSGKSLGDRDRKSGCSTGRSYPSPRRSVAAQGGEGGAKRRVGASPRTISLRELAETPPPDRPSAGHPPRASRRRDEENLTPASRRGSRCRLRRGPR